MPIPAPRRAALLAALSLASAALFAPALAQAQDKKTVKVGIVVGSQEEIFKVVKQVAARDGLTLDITVFNDYQLPNAASTSCPLA